MLPLSYPAPYNLVLAALLALDVGLLAGGLLFGPPDPSGAGRLRRPLRLSLSALLLLAAALQWRLVGSGYAAWVLLGMSLGFLGDLVMARVIPFPHRLVGGMLVFGLGHIAYIAAVYGLARGLGPWNGWLALALWLAMAPVGVGLWYGAVRAPGGPAALNAAALIYGLLMVTLCSLAAGLAIHEARFVALAAGTLLFLASDVLLGNYNLRGRPWKGVNDVIWVTYNLGQLLIVSSVAAGYALSPL